MTEQDHSAHIDALPNLRDLGGYQTDDGQVVRSGLAYRSDQLMSLQDGALDAFARLGIRTVYDLRTSAERDAWPDVTPPQTRQVVLDVLADSADAAPAQLLQLLSDPPTASERLNSEDVERLFTNAYRELITLPSARSSYSQLFSDLAKDETGPALWHCTAGKDRTGWAAAALLLILGVPEDVVMDDYLLSNRYILPAYQVVMETFTAQGGDAKLLEPILGVAPAYLEGALAQMRADYGEIASYFREGLGLDDITADQLRARLLMTI